MAQIIRMPSVLAGSEEAAIANWLVTEGQVIAVGEPLAEIETEKAIVEYNAEEAGIVGRVLLAAGESGEIGAPIAVLIAEGETDADIDAALGGAPAVAADDAAPAAVPAASTASTDAPAATPAPAAVAGSAAPAGAATSPAAESGTPARDPESGAPIAEAASVAQAATDADTLDPAASTTATATTTGSAPASPDPAPGQGGAASASTGAAADASTGANSGERLFVSPIARKLARQQGLDPAAIAGSGPGGRIVRRDVETALAAGTASAATGTAASATSAADASAPAAVSASAASPAAPGASGASATPAAPGASAAPAAPARGAAATGSASTGDYDLIPHTGMRRAIARRLTESKSTVPHFYLTAEPRVDALLALRAEVNAQSPVRVSVNDFVVKAVAAAFADVPEANVTWSDEGMRKHHAVDIAVAVATDGGLVTPVVRGVGTKSLTAVSSTIAELVAKAKDKRLKQDELEGGSFSVSNLGMYGTVEFSAILNPPQSGILAVGAAKQQAVVIDGELAAATVMRCTLSVDHRAVDGALAAQWLAAFTKRIENPLSILV
ncbi:2-oxo acid dehydrogenase subunit E2 [Herbiconiux sp. P17]|uniref:2-oxo acid dehydrogenase subunit E2 n=1 Tax=Herbiconiux wuyangfengii TaxID=3342794 RepID=UPI0035BA94BA